MSVCTCTGMPKSKKRKVYQYRKNRMELSDLLLDKSTITNCGLIDCGWLWIDSNISLHTAIDSLRNFGREDLDNFMLNKMNNGKMMVMYMYAYKFHKTQLSWIFADVPWRGGGWMCAGDIRNWPKFTVTCCSGSQLLGNLRFMNFIYSFLPWKTKIFESFWSLMHSDFTCIRPAFEVQKSKKQKQCFNNYYLAFI